jgi:hypothetical protein
MWVMHFLRFTLPVLLLFAAHAAVAEQKRPAPQTAKDLIGVWIGFDQDDLTFTRLELRADSTGYCARVSPGDTSLHSYGVQVYRIDKWSVRGGDLILNSTPVSSNAEPLYLKGRLGGIASLSLEVGGLNKKWKRRLVLNPESRIQASNQETKEAIDGIRK